MFDLLETESLPLGMSCVAGGHQMLSASCSVQTSVFGNTWGVSLCFWLRTLQTFSDTMISHCLNILAWIMWSGITMHILFLLRRVRIEERGWSCRNPLSLMHGQQEGFVVFHYVCYATLSRRRHSWAVLRPCRAFQSGRRHAADELSVHGRLCRQRVL